MNTLHEHVKTGSESVADVAERVSQRTDEALLGAKRIVGGTAQTVQSGLDSLRDSVPEAVSRAATQAEDLARRGIDKARHAAEQAKERAIAAGDMTVRRIQDEPVKAVLIAAAVGAAATLIVQWFARARAHRH